LDESQGAALFADNNGVFSEQDYAGFEDIGQGGKVEDATTTGMFGRGALSMYHFTDLLQTLWYDILLRRLSENS
jgi:sacsin